MLEITDFVFFFTIEGLISNDEMRRFNHLLFLVHGAGCPTDNETGNSRLDDALNNFQETLGKVQEATAEYRKARTLVLGVEWYTRTSMTLGGALDAFTPANMEPVRTLLRDTLGTAMSFLSPKFRNIMVEETRCQLEWLHAMVQQRFDGFQPP